MTSVNSLKTSSLTVTVLNPSGGIENVITVIVLYITVIFENISISGDQYTRGASDQTHLFILSLLNLSIMSTPREKPPPNSSSITLTRDGDWFVAIDDMTDVASQGTTRAEALANLAEAIELHKGGGDPIEDPDTFLQEELDIDVAELDDQEPPWME